MRNLNRKICKIFSDNLKYYMYLYGVDRYELADALDFKYSTVCNWLSCYSYASEDKIKKIADYFGISKYQLTESNDEDRPVISSSFKKRKELMEICALLDDGELEALKAMAKQFAKNK